MNVLDKVPPLSAGRHEEGFARALLGAEPGVRRSGGRRRAEKYRDNTAGRSNVWLRIATRCSPSTALLPSIGLTCARPIPWTACSRLCGQDGAHEGSLSPTTARLIVFKLVIAASRIWRLKGTNQLPKVIADVRFTDGIEVIQVPAKPPPDAGQEAAGIVQWIGKSVNAGANLRPRRVILESGLRRVLLFHES